MSDRKYEDLYDIFFVCVAYLNTKLSVVYTF